MKRTPAIYKMTVYSRITDVLNQLIIVFLRFLKEKQILYTFVKLPCENFVQKDLTLYCSSL